jgi:hypothetical protein
MVRHHSRLASPSYIFSLFNAFFAQMFCSGKIGNITGRNFLIQRTEAFERSWSDIGGFKFFKRSFLGKMPSVLIILDKSSINPSRSRLRGVPGGWPIDLSELAELLNDAFKKWGTS